MSGGREVFIRVVLDVCGALVDRDLSGHLHLFDTTRDRGGTGWGGRNPATAVAPGDTVFWAPTPIECEAYFDLDAVVFSDAGISPSLRLHARTGGFLWAVDIDDAPIVDAPYRMTLTLGDGVRMTSDARLIAADRGTAR